MDKDWRTILRFAILGFGVTIVAVGVQFLPDSSSSNYSLSAVMIVLCPASLLLAPAFALFFEAAEPGTAVFYGLWLLVGLANAAIYSIVAVAYVGLRKKPEGPATS
jgi:hypothetical protein